MGKVKARKVFTPGSKPVKSSPGPGRPRKTEKPKRRGRRLQYPQEKVVQAIQAVKQKTMSLGEASKHYGIPKTTIYDRMKSSKEQLQLGRPTELTKDEETIIVQRLKVMGMWGFPLTAHDLRYLIKSYLDSLGRTIFRHVS
jgi:transposase-like protein